MRLPSSCASWLQVARMRKGQAKVVALLSCPPNLRWCARTQPQGERVCERSSAAVRTVCTYSELPRCQDTLRQLRGKQLRQLPRTSCRRSQRTVKEAGPCPPCYPSACCCTCTLRWAPSQGIAGARARLLRVPALSGQRRRHRGARRAGKAGTARSRYSHLFRAPPRHARAGGQARGVCPRPL